MNNSTIIGNRQYDDLSRVIGDYGGMEKDSIVSPNKDSRDRFSADAATLNKLDRELLLVDSASDSTSPSLNRSALEQLLYNWIVNQ